MSNIIMTSRETRLKTFLLRCVLVAMGVMFSALVIYSSRLARADWLRRRPTPPGVEEAIRLDPLNGYGYTLRAEMLERDGRDSRAAWMESAGRDPRNAETLIQIALGAERAGALADAENELLQAAQYNQTWLPRWSLTNFYFRRRNPAAGFHWAKLAAERAGGDLSALFQLLDQAAATPEFIVAHVLAANRNVLLEYLAYCLRRKQAAGIERVSLLLAGLIPGHPPGWPGLDIDPFGSVVHRTYAALPEERQALLASVDSMLDQGGPAAAVALWNVLAERGIVSSGKWNAQQVVVNPRFAATSVEAGLDWRFTNVDGMTAGIWPDLHCAVISLTGRQPDSVVLLTQRLFLPANHIYRFHSENLTRQLVEPAGIGWEIQDAPIGSPGASLLKVPASNGWTAEETEIPASPQDRIVQLALRYKRPPGTVRSEGELRIRAVTMETGS